jgi:acetyl esterase
VTIAPEIQSLIDWGRTVNERYGELPLPKLREVLRDEFDQELRRRGVVVEQVGAVSEHAVAVDGGEIAARVFTPPGAGPYPAFLHFHGGGFVFGTTDSLFTEAKCAHICRSADCLVVTVEYRLAPERRFPTAPEDCYAALLWTIENASRLEINPARIAVGGESAGGNLAAAVALIARDHGGPALALQLLEVPVTDISNTAGDHPSVALFADGYGLDRAEMDSFSRAYLADPADGAHPYASPLRAGDLTGVAPAHVLTAEYDILRDSGEAYARRLERAGIETTLHRFSGHTHGSAVLWQTWDPARAWMDDVICALRHALQGASLSTPVSAETGSAG